ncbi:hypothetical protein M5W83_26695 [Paenibacillus thiaminolyticus]|jgi:hypothetical protein|uniref:Uncharacterized protein n=1 Tax=Paenibacillus thiaminolyticus TaxID=49283 RepID=A0AAP9DR98_PANTH|nr:hypothetical protein [Paenibacillus thiaminolyticus]MCY9535525.1 hypothetical protein [Paenibacillus thiaminolyticus]MCY9601702.1 hypothetical protein [Paenibacillus thiaminolyticus]MCY9610740.1 hypothetical protein [Paenibacillus thiaminolyticus]MCY9615847.1 hypothetical protein [Paenibacillus thiaminolyticus]MCY9622149.1 hypothetical protein [Paenibacillus thiaminolyticus]
MKLIGSKQEQDFRKELEGSNIVLAQDAKAEAILNVLRTTFGEVKSAYILNWTPEQGEDIFTILVDLDRIAKVEISRVNPSEVPIIETFNLKDFQRRLSKIFQIKLAVAIDLAKKEHQNG